jgi:hypothetical protein
MAKIIIVVISVIFLLLISAISFSMQDSISSQAFETASASGGDVYESDFGSFHVTIFELRYPNMGRCMFTQVYDRSTGVVCSQLCGDGVSCLGIGNQ